MEKMSWNKRFKIIIFAVLGTVILVAPIMILLHFIGVFVGTEALFISGVIYCILWTYLLITDRIEIILRKIKGFVIREGS